LILISQNTWKVSKDRCEDEKREIGVFGRISDSASSTSTMIFTLFLKNYLLLLKKLGLTGQDHFLRRFLHLSFHQTKFKINHRFVKLKFTESAALIISSSSSGSILFPPLKTFIFF